RVVDGGAVAGGELAEPAARLDLRPGAGDVQQALQLYVVRDGVEEAIDGLGADRLEHLPDVLGGVGDVAVRIAVVVRIWQLHRSWSSVLGLSGMSELRSQIQEPTKTQDLRPKT